MKLRRGPFAGALAVPLVFVLSLGACKRTESGHGETAPAVSSVATSAPSEPSAAAPATSAAPANSAAPASAASAVAATDSAPWLAAPPVGGKAVGNTSVAFKVKLEGGLEALYKPRSKRHNDRYKGEVAGYRFGQALGLSNVPPAYLRRFELGALTKALGTGSPAATLLASEAVPTKDGEVPGALMPWRPRFDVLSLEKPEWRAKWKAWLGDGPFPTGDDAKLAGQISTLVCFDFVTGNWDRWSGGNIVIDQATQTILFIDNDAAFFEVPPGGFGKEQEAIVLGTNRFSRSFVQAIRRLDEKALLEAIGEETPGAPLLSKKAVAGVSKRREKLLAIVDEKIKKLGEDRVLAFP